MTIWGTSLPPKVDKLTREYTRTGADERAVAEGCRIDERAAVRVRDFFYRFLRHSKGQWAGKPFELMPWQWDDIILPLFGWIRADGRRRYRSAYIEIPKKNGKSALASGVGLYLLAGDGEAGAEVYSVAADRDQASIVHGEAIRMVEASPGLRRHLSINLTTKSIMFAKTKSAYKALSSEANTKEGLNAHGLIIDELHAWPGRSLYSALRYAGRARSQPLRFEITTAGDDPMSICRERHDYAKGILSGSIEDVRTFAYIRSARAIAEGDTVDDDYREPATWSRANPSLGVTIDPEDFRADVEEAERTPVSLADFKRYSLNVWTVGSSPWIRPESWGACQRTYSAEDLEGLPCYAGLDLSRTRDMSALALFFPGADKGPGQTLFRFWLPEARLLEPDAPAHYRIWAESGAVKFTPGDVCDYGEILRDVQDLARRYRILEVAFDPYNAEQLTQDIETTTGIQRVSFGQTVGNFAGPTGELERLILGQGIYHNGHPVATWQMGHVEVSSDSNGNKRPRKPSQHSPKKIDGVVALIMALARAMAGESSGSVRPGTSVYDQAGIVMVG